MKSRQKKYKKGAASFYIVAFSTLILMIIATSFAAIIISEVTRTSNDDLSQSAYDSAMAGVEDAKLAFYNYQNCLTQKKNNGTMPDGCSEILNYMDNPDCDMVGKILGRSSSSEGQPVVVEESNTVGNNMQQAYTCVTMTDSVPGYESTLSSSNMIRVIKAKFEDGVDASNIARVKLSWFSDTNTSTVKYSNFDGSNVSFKAATVGSIAAPPTISLAMIQTDEKFTISDFQSSNGADRSDRGLIYLVPTDSKEKAKKTNASTYIGAYNDTSKNVITARQFADSNNKLKKNLPYAVYCSEDNGDYLCSATINLPKPLHTDVRNDDTFIFVAGLPYGAPTTDFLLEFECADDKVCAKCKVGDTDCDPAAKGGTANLKGVQIEVDSTGKANDLFRRVSVRLDNRDDMSLSIMGPLELLESSGRDALNKNYTVLTEHNFPN